MPKGYWTEILKQKKEVNIIMKDDRRIWKTGYKRWVGQDYIFLESLKKKNRR